MSKYQNGKIYKIVCNITNDIYIGSTIQTLKERLYGHRSKRKNCSSCKIIDRGDYKICLIEKYPCDDITQLKKREGYWQSQIKCINIQREGMTDKEKDEKRKKYDKKYRNINPEKRKEYYKQNKEKEKIKNKIYIENNKEFIQKIKHKYYMNHKEEAKAYNIKYRADNKEILKQKKRERYLRTKHLRKPPVSCECGGTYEDTASKKKRHEETKKHINFYL